VPQTSDQTNNVPTGFYSSNESYRVGKSQSRVQEDTPREVPNL